MPSRIRQSIVGSAASTVAFCTPIALSGGEAHAGAIFGADLQITYADWQDGKVVPPTFNWNESLGGNDNVVESYVIDADGWSSWFDTANISEGLQIRSINDVGLYWLPSDAHWSTIEATVQSAAYFNDEVSFNADEMPDGGYIQYFTSLDGGLSHDLNPRLFGYDIQRAVAEVSLHFQNAGLHRALFEEELIASQLGPNVRFNDVERLDQAFIPSPLVSIGPGESAAIQLELRTGVDFLARDLDGSQFEYMGTADASSTATIVGVAVFDPDMNPVMNVTVNSANGLVYTVIPEPSSGLLLLGIPALLLRRRR